MKKYFYDLTSFSFRANLGTQNTNFQKHMEVYYESG